MDSTVEQTNEKLKFKNEINYLKYFRHIVRYSLYEENYSFSPENFYHNRRKTTSFRAEI